MERCSVSSANTRIQIKITIKFTSTNIINRNTKSYAVFEKKSKPPYSVVGMCNTCKVPLENYSGSFSKG